MFSSDKWFGAEAGFYNNVATQSLRFEDGSSSYLKRTPSTATDQQTWVWSAWVKLGNIGTNKTLFAARTDSSGTYLTMVVSSAHDFRMESNLSTSYPLYKTNALFRDPSAWYNFVVAVDMRQATSTNRIKVYVNGQLQTTASYNLPDNTTTELNVNSTADHYIGRQAGASYMDGYLAEVNFIDGLSFFSDTSGTANTSFNIDSFGETKNGVWIPIAYSGSYGTNGFRLEFKQTGVGTASTTTIGADTSGNTNHYTSSGIVASDCAMPDSPENNFATGHPLIPIPSGSLSEGNLAYVRGSEASHGNCGTTFALPTTGKWYWEVMSGKSANNETIGVANILDHNPQLAQTGDHVGERTGDYVYRTNAIKMSGTNVAGGSSYGATYTGGDVIGVAWSSDDGTITFYKNNASQGIAYSSITQAEGKYVPAVSQAETSSETVFNFGQDSSFAGHKTAQGNTDGNGIGDFYYAPPSGYLALCTSNLPEPTIGPNSDTQADDHFTPYIWTGNGSNPRAFTDVGFQADWIWIKRRTGSTGTKHHLQGNSTIGDNKTMLPNEPNPESTPDANGTISDTTTAGGFTVNAGATSAYMVNTNSSTYVAWLWKANAGITSSNSEGTTTSTVQANTTAGFSIVNYDGNSSSRTVGHGLDSAPEWVIVKTRATERWTIFHTSISNGYIYLNENFATQTGNADERFGDSSSVVVPNSTVVTLGANNSDVNQSGENYILYVFLVLFLLLFLPHEHQHKTEHNLYKD